jgi:plastocyanin
MNRYTLFCIFAGILLLSGSARPRPDDAPDSGVRINGQATLTQANSSQIERDASRVVVWLAPLSSVQPVRTFTEQRHYRLVQHDKRFEPGLLVVPVGSVVDFPNLDPWFHNVFSLYRGKRFDLGLYQAGSMRSVHFDRPGPSYLFCNIHPEMTGVVLAVESPLFGVSDKSGRYSIADVPPGKYMLQVWYENSTAESLQALQRAVSIEPETRSLPQISVVVNKARVNHKNKYGQDYDPDTLKTDY